MRANSPGALLLSLALHGAVAAVLLLFTFYVATRETPPVIFDLVAGPATDPGSLAAPAAGNAALKVPVPQPVPTPAPLRPEPVARPVKTPAPPKPVVKPPPDRISYEEFIKQQGKPVPAKSAPAPKPVRVPKIDTAGITRGVAGGSTEAKGGGGGKALTRAEADAMTVYEAQVRNRLREAHEQVKPEGLGDLVSAEVEFFVAANGELGNVRISRASGHPDFDASVLAAFRRYLTPGPRPDRKSDTWRLTFRMKEE